MRSTKYLAACCLVAPALAQDADLPLPSTPPVSIPTVKLGRKAQLQVEVERPDLVGPFGVLGENPLEEGALQFSYRYVREDFEGLQDGRSEIPDEDVFDEGFERLPTKLVREQHLFTALYGYSDSLSLLMSIPWMSNSMDFETEAGEAFDARTIGLGDVVLTGLYELRDKEEGSVHLNLSVSVPTGSHDERDVLPGSGENSVKLPYPLQLSSGTVDVTPGVTYVHLADQTSWGAQGRVTLRPTENSDDYALGNEAFATAWVSRQFKEDLSGSLRVEWAHAEDYRGQDPALDPSADPSQDPDAQGGDYVKLMLGVNYSHMGGHRFGAEVGGPLFQDLNGPQLESDIVYLVGWHFSF